MQMFIKAAEVWQPDAADARLKLAAGHYGTGVEAFQTSSESMSFGCGEGLPGQSWAEGRPLIWTELNDGNFLRAAAADEAGIACGVAVPVFAGEFLQAVLVLFCGKGDEIAGAVEVWSNPPGSDTELKLVAGYYGELERFEWVSRRLTLVRGRGLPGGAWAAGKPLIIGDLGASDAFLRSRNAAESRITTGLAVPLPEVGGNVQILTLLSAKGTPIARRFEVWAPNEDHSALVFESGYDEAGSDLAERYRGVSVSKGEGPLGAAWLTGKPAISATGDPANEMSILLPVLDAVRLQSIVALGL